MFSVHESLLYPNREQDVLPTFDMNIVLFILCSISQEIFQRSLIFNDCFVLQKLLLFDLESH